MLKSNYRFPVVFPCFQTVFTRNLLILLLFSVFHYIYINTVVKNVQVVSATGLRAVIRGP